MLLNIIGQLLLVHVSCGRAAGAAHRDGASQNHAEDRNTSFHDGLPKNEFWNL
jgi:hypothetical protein